MAPSASAALALSLAALSAFGLPSAPNSAPKALARESLAAGACEGACAEEVEEEALSLKVALLQQRLGGHARLLGPSEVQDVEGEVEEDAEEEKEEEVGHSGEASEVTDKEALTKEAQAISTWRSVDSCKRQCSSTKGCKFAVMCGSQCYLKETSEEASATLDILCTVFEESSPTCAAYGCPKEHVSSNLCQCTSECEQRGNCCEDYHDACIGIAPESALQLRKQQPPKSNTSVSNVFGHPSADIVYPEYEGFTLWLAEEFNEPLDLDTDPIWTWSDGGLTEGQIRFAKEAIRFEDGKMKIYATRGNPSGAQGCSHAEVGYVGRKPLTSGEFRSRYNMFRFGRYEMRMKAPSPQNGKPEVNGNFISTMFVYRDAKFKHWREIDIEVTGDSIHSVTTNVLNANYRSAWSPGIQSSQHGYQKEIKVRGEFHVYAFEWLPTSVTWYIDGSKCRTFTSGYLKVPDLSAKIMMNLWIFKNGYGFGGRQGYNNHYPMYNEYDYFRFYKWDQETKYPCPDMKPTCLTEDDRYLAGNNPKDGIAQEGMLPGHQSPCK